MGESHDSDPLRSLGERLDRARHMERDAPAGGLKEDTGLPRGAVAFAFRVAAELVAALAVAGAIGWVIDRWLGTQPWGLIVFFFLGAAAGILNVFRAVGGSEMMRETTSRTGSTKPGRGRTGEDED